MGLLQSNYDQILSVVLETFTTFADRFYKFLGILYVVDGSFTVRALRRNLGVNIDILSFLELYLVLVFGIEVTEVILIIVHSLKSLIDG